MAELIKFRKHFLSINHIIKMNERARLKIFCDGKLNEMMAMAQTLAINSKAQSFHLTSKTEFSSVWDSQNINEITFRKK